MSNEEDPPYPTPQQSSAVESWSDMSNEEDPPYPTIHQSSVAESWSDMSSEEDTPYPTPQSVIVLQGWHTETAGVRLVFLLCFARSYKNYVRYSKNCDFLVGR